MHRAASSQTVERWLIAFDAPMNPADLVRLLLAGEERLDVLGGLVSRPPIVKKPADDFEVDRNIVAVS